MRVALKAVLFTLTVLLVIGGSASAESPVLTGTSLGTLEVDIELTSLLILGAGLTGVVAAIRRRSQRRGGLSA